MNQVSPAEVVKLKHANGDECYKTLIMLLEVMGQCSMHFIVFSF